MSLPKGIINVAIMRQRRERGGQERQADLWDKSQPDALALWRDTYLASLEARNYSPDTLESRRDAFRVFLTWAAERELARVTQITRPILEAYQRWLSRYTKSDGKRLGWSTQLSRLSALKDWFRWLTKQDVIMHNPASELEMPRQEKRLPGAALSPSQLAALFAVPNVADPLGLRDRAMLETLYSTGMRRSEVCHLELPDFNAERGTIHVRRGKGKKDRMVPVGAQAIMWIEKYLTHARPRLCLDTRTQAVFLTGYGGPFHPDVVSRYVSKWMREAGVPGSCHTLRHTCATHIRFQQLEFAQDLEGRTLHLGSPPFQRRSLIGKLHLFHDLLPSPFQHFGGLARQIDAGHGDVEMRLVNGLVFGAEQTLSLGLILGAEAFGAARRLVFGVKHALAATVHPVSIKHGESPRFRG